MTFEEIKALIQIVNKSELSEFRFKDGDSKIVIRTSKYSKHSQQAPQIHYAAPQSVAAPTVAHTASNTVVPDFAPVPPKAPAAIEKALEVASNLVAVKSPIVGTFYTSASPDKPAFVKVGDSIDKGTVVCMIEAMKLFNEIESEVKGEIVEVLVKNASPVEYDQVLFMVKPK